MAPLTSRARAASVVAALLCAAPARAQAPTLETAVKANFLYKFAPFVTWPPQPSAASPFQVCIAGADPFGAVLDAAVRGQRIAGRPIQVRRIARLQEVGGCHIVYLGSVDGQPLEDRLRVLRGLPILTVTDDRAGAAESAIRFVVRGGRVRFAINRATARDAGLTISSKLLDLAIAVDN